MCRCNECKHRFGGRSTNTGDGPKYECYCSLTNGRFLYDEYADRNCKGFEPRWRKDEAQKAEST